jgi:fluoride exporter
LVTEYFIRRCFYLNEMNFYNFLYVGLGGFLGSIARFAVVKSLDQKFQSLFPYGTFAVNFLGSLILGFLYALTIRKIGPNQSWILFLGTGICGGFTTFSSFALENFNLLHLKPGISILYILTSIIAGLVAVGIGFFAGKTI